MNLPDQLQKLANPAQAVEMAAYHKVPRQYLGVSNPQINDLCKDARRLLPLPERIQQAQILWASNVHECRIAATKLFDQRKITPDDQVWSLLQSWLPDLDSWAIADHVAKSGSFRLVADPSRLDQVQKCTKSSSLWSRRIALVMTLPWARMKSPNPQDMANREKILGWAAGYADDPEWFIQKSIAWWLRELSANDPQRALIFIGDHGAAMKPFARKDALRNL